MSFFSVPSPPSKSPASQIKIKPTFRTGERIFTAEAFAAAEERVRVRCEAITRYLQVRRELEGYVSHSDIYRCAGSLVYAAPDNPNAYETALMRTTRTSAKEFAIVCIKGQRKIKSPRLSLSA